MAEDRQITPEKQLLKLIEEPGGTAKGPAAVQKARLKRAGAGFFSPAAVIGALFGWLSFFKRASQKKTGRSKMGLSFKTVNRVLILASLVLAVYLVTDTFALAVSLMRPPNFVMQKDGAAPAAIDSPSVLSDEGSYVERASRRNIFKEHKEAAPKKIEQGAAAAAANAASGLSLVGISWSSSPDAIVEDKENQKTYFLKRGMSFGNGMRVTAIFKDKVVIETGGEEYEIK